MHHLDLAGLTLDSGKHKRRDDGLCLMEAVAYFADEPHSDRPQCASEALTTFGIGLNDAWDDEWRQRLKPFIPRLVGTRDGRDEARGWLAIDWLIRTYTPAWLDLAGLGEHATGLRDLRRLVDRAAWAAEQEVAEARISAAYSAARSAARSAAGSAAHSVLEPTVTALRESALDLFDRMIDPAVVAVTR